MQIANIETRIYEIRCQKVMLDFDLAELYEVETKVLNQAVKRNIDRFPADFMIQITRDEYNSLRSQFVTLERGRGKYTKYLPYAFTEQGVSMLSSVLNSSKAIQMNIQIIRAFVFMRQYALSQRFNFTPSPRHSLTLSVFPPLNHLWVASRIISSTQISIILVKSVLIVP